MQNSSFFGKLTTRPTLFLVLAGLLVMAVAAPAAGATHKEGHVGNPKQALVDSLSVDLDNIEVTESELGTGTFDGVFNVTGFDVEDGQLLALGNIVGTFTPDDGEAVDFDEAVAVPASTTNGDGLGILQNGNETCDILFLELGPVFLDVLGLVVEIPDPIVLDIYAERGPGKLLGNLLCAVVGLLDEPTNGNGGLLDNLLNRINNLLGGLLG
jgi:hypothetical protein